MQTTSREFATTGISQSSFYFYFCFSFATFVDFEFPLYPPASASQAIGGGLRAPKIVLILETLEIECMEMYGRSKWNFYTVRIAISYVTMATMETELLLEVQIAVDAAVKELETWSAVIAFTVIKPYCLEPEHCDNIIQYLKPMWLGCKVYFPVSKYSVDILD